MGKHLEQALPSVYTLQCLTGKADNNNKSSSKTSFDCGLHLQLQKFELWVLFYSDDLQRFPLWL